MMCFKKQPKFVKVGRSLLKMEDIKDVVFVCQDGEPKETATAPFNIKICLKYGNNIELSYPTWDERQVCFDYLCALLERL